MARQARIFAQILDSSLAQDWKVRLVFMDMLLLAEDGIVDIERSALARRTNVPKEVINEALDKLEAPDPLSRDRSNNGRRIVRLDEHRDWGWKILNWHKYSDAATTTEKTAAARERKRLSRERRKDQLQGELTLPIIQADQSQLNQCHAVTSKCHADVTQESRDVTQWSQENVTPLPPRKEEEKIPFPSLPQTPSLPIPSKEEEKVPLTPLFSTPSTPLSGQKEPQNGHGLLSLKEGAEVIWKLYPRKVAKPEGVYAIIKALKKFPFDYVLQRTTAFAKAVEHLPPDRRQFIPYPSTFFNQQRFNDDPETWDIDGGSGCNGSNGRNDWVRIKALKTTVGNHPANPQFAGYFPANVTPEMKADFEDKKARLAQLTAQL